MSWGNNSYSIHIEDNKIVIGTESGHFVFDGEVKSNFNVGSLADATLDTVVVKRWLDEVKMDLTKELEELSEKLDETSYDLGNRINVLDEETQDRFANVDAELDRLGSRISENTEAISVLGTNMQNGFANVNSKIKNVNIRVDNTNTRIDNANHQIINVNKRVDATNSRVDETNARIDATNNRIDETNSRIDGVQNQIRQVDQKYDKKDKNTNARIDTLAKECASAKQEIDVRINTILTLIDAINQKTKQRLDVVEKRIDGAEFDLRWVHGILKNLNARVTALENRPTPVPPPPGPGPVPPHPVPPEPPMPPTPHPTPKPSPRVPTCHKIPNFEMAMFVAHYNIINEQYGTLYRFVNGMMSTTQFIHSIDNLSMKGWRCNRCYNYIKKCCEEMISKKTSSVATKWLNEAKKELLRVKTDNKWRQFAPILPYRNDYYMDIARSYGII